MAITRPTTARPITGRVKWPMTAVLLAVMVTAGVAPITAAAALQLPDREVADWSLQPPPSLGMAPNRNLSSDSCLTAGSCVAAGHSRDETGVDVTLVERWNGSSWSFRPSPHPKGTSNSFLAGAQCLSTTPCLAAGEYTKPAGRLLTMAERWNGRHRVQAMPNPAGSTGVQLADASGSSGSASALVPIVPCRLVDTRADSVVGVRTTPIAAQETMDFEVWGVNGNCDIPSTATGIASNVTAVNPTDSSFLTVFPGDAARPFTSNLNWTPSSSPTPNQVTVGLSASGGIKVFNNSGTINVIVDVVGYYVPSPSGSGPVGLTGATGPAGPAGATGATAATGATGLAGPVNRISNTQIALLQWGQDPGRAATFPTGSVPVGVAFDGTNIWVANGGSNTVSKINRVTGAKTDYATGTSPTEVAFDGANIWVANFGSNTVSKINPNGVAPGTPINFTTGNGPRGVAFDGTNIWVTNQNSNTVSKINPNGVAPGAPINYTTGATPVGVAFDGTNIWVTNQNSNTVSKINPNAVAPGAPINYTTGATPAGVAFDGSNIWVTNFGSNTVSKIDPNAVAPGAPINYTTGANPEAVAFDGTNIWVTNFGSTTVSKINPNGVAPGTPINDTTGSVPHGVAFDGTNIWVTNGASNTVSKLIP